MQLARVARTSLPFVVLLLATPLLRAGVLVVDADGGGDFTTLSAAVAAAVDGDMILVHDGDYVEPAPIVIDGKALTIAGEWVTPTQFWPSVTIRPGLVIQHLAPGKMVFLENLAFIGADGTSSTASVAALQLRDNSSHVRVQSCTLYGGTGTNNNSPDGAAAVDISNSASTALVDCDLFGGDGQFSPSLAVVTGNGGSGVRLDVGQVHLGYSYVRGGAGGSDAIGGWGQGGNGGAGVERLAGTILGAGAYMRGGDGGISFHGGNGGIGLQMGGALGFAWIMAGSFASGGEGGLSDSGPNGAPGAAMFDPNGQVVNYGGSPHGFDVTSPLREGEGGTLVLEGFSGPTLLFASLTPHQLPLSGYQGVLMLSPTSLIGPFVIGIGSGTLPIVAPSLPIGLESLNVFVQPAYVGPQGTVLGAGHILTLLDASF
jgi:hypothetical protein